MTSQISELNSLLLLAVVVADNSLFATSHAAGSIATHLTATRLAAASIFTHIDAASTLANLFFEHTVYLAVLPLTGSTPLTHLSV